jgi:hypothetical protein
MDRIDVLKELYRILKSNGMIILVCKAEFKTTNDIAADELLNIYRDSISDTIFNMKELKDDLELGGFDEVEIFPYKGMLVALGFKKKPNNI